MARKTNKDPLPMPDETPEAQPLSERSENVEPEGEAAPEGAVVLNGEIERPVVRRLRVNRYFSGAQIQERSVIPGTYYEDDPNLFDLGAWLVEQQYAEWVD